MRRSRRVTLAITLGSIPCLAAAYPTATWLRDYCDLTPSEVRSVLAGFALAALAFPAIFALPLRTRRKAPPSDLAQPLIVRKTVCTLCSTTIDTPIEARDWVRCPNCSALVPL